MQCRFRTTKHGSRVPAVRWMPCDANTRLEINVAAVDEKRLLNDVFYLQHEFLHRFIGGYRRNKAGKLVGPETTDDSLIMIVACSEHFFQAAGH